MREEGYSLEGPANPSPRQVLPHHHSPDAGVSIRDAEGWAGRRRAACLPHPRPLPLCEGEGSACFAALSMTWGVGGGRVAKGSDSSLRSE